MELILATKEEGDDLNKIVRNYVLKMKVRNKIGLKLSRWVAFKELPRDLLKQQIPAQTQLQKAASTSDTSSHLKGSGYDMLLNYSKKAQKKSNVKEIQKQQSKF